MDAIPRCSRGRAATAIGLLIMLLLCGLDLSRSAPRSQAGSVPRPSAPRSPDLGRPSDLPPPSRLSVPQFESKLFEFLNARRYESLGWLRDKGVRDTGPYVDGKYYGTHPAVRVHYSPGVIRWLLGGR